MERTLRQECIRSGRSGRDDRPPQNIRVKPTPQMGAFAAFSRMSEKTFQSAVVFATVVLPFSIGLNLFPDVIIHMFVAPWNVLFASIAIPLSLVGARLSAVFGCDLWHDLTCPRPTTKPTQTRRR